MIQYFGEEMTRFSEEIKRHYIKPAIYLEETEWEKHFGFKIPSYYRLETYIWLDILLPEYRVAIPEDISSWNDDELFIRSNTISTRFVTYKPTGKQVYDNSIPPPKAIVFEYVLEQYLSSNILKTK